MNTDTKSNPCTGIRSRLHDLAVEVFAAAQDMTVDNAIVYQRLSGGAQIRAIEKILETWLTSRIRWADHEQALWMNEKVDLVKWLEETHLATYLSWRLKGDRPSRISDHQSGVLQMIIRVLSRVTGESPYDTDCRLMRLVEKHDAILKNPPLPTTPGSTIRRKRDSRLLFRLRTGKWIDSEGAIYSDTLSPDCFEAVGDAGAKR